MSSTSTSHSAASSSAAQRKKMEEKNAKTLRELMAIPANKVCFECGQRGPTYVNVTHGSFCCMHCSGILRGLNPPHRVKSVSMSSFTDEDILRLRTRGNEENGRIWLGLYDKKVLFEPRVDDEVRQHLVQKYENKRWYVSPDDLAEQRRLLAEHTRRDSASSHKSHLSNQSAPPNLHPNVLQDPFDLLSGDLPKAGNYCQSMTGSPPPPLTGFLQQRQPPPLMQSASSALSSLACFSTSAQPEQLFPPPDNFGSGVGANNISASSTLPPPTTTPRTPASVASNNFDLPFSSLKIDSKPTVTKSRSPAATAATGGLPQSASMFVGAATSIDGGRPVAAAPAAPPHSQSFVTVFPSAPTLAATTTMTTPDWPNSLSVTATTAFPAPVSAATTKVGTTSDGRPIMSVSSTLPDYSALEELFRGPSSNQSITTMAPSIMPFGGGVVGPFGPASITSSQTTAAAVDVFGLSAFGAPKGGGNAPFVSKSNTTIGGGFDTFAQSTVNFGGNNGMQFHSATNLPTTVAGQQFSFDGQNNGFFQSQANPTQSDAGESEAVKNWNPFA